MIEEVKKEIRRQLQESKERLSHIKAKGWVAPNEEQLIVHLKGLLSFINTLEVKKVKIDVWKDNFELPQENVPIIACCVGDTLVIQGVFKIINKGYESEFYKISNYNWDVVKKWAYTKELFPYRNREIPIYFENELVEDNKPRNKELESYKAWEESLLIADRIKGYY